MDLKDFASEQVVAGWLLVLSGLVFVVGGTLYAGRAILKWPAAQSQSYLTWERGFVMAAILVATLGLALLEGLLEAAGDKILASTDNDRLSPCCISRPSLRDRGRIL